MILIIMCVLLIAYLLSWFGKRRAAIGVYVITFLLSLYWFWANVTVAIGLSL